jgi:hypothetical protein
MPIIKQNQNLFDATVQHSGALSNLFAVAVANGIGITDALVPGNNLVIPAVTDKAVVKKFLNDFYDIITIEPDVVQGGIGYMQIGTTFKVS